VNLFLREPLGKNDHEKFNRQYPKHAGRLYKAVAVDNRGCPYYCGDLSGNKPERA
jgi:hypothetical protein